jgi:hypothetical protein
MQSGFAYIGDMKTNIKSTEQKSISLDTKARVLVIKTSTDTLSLPIRSPRDQNPEGWREHNEQMLKQAFGFWFVGDEISEEVNKAWKHMGLIQ